ncbi:MAG: hypothetical protein JNM91_09845 [Flavobacteriales bacterium]|nr:hypothetical protein [Flavobacteriales bacterium]
MRADVILGQKAGSSGGVFEEVIHTSDQAFYLLLSRQKQKYVQKLGPDMKKIYQKQIPAGMVDPYLSPTIVLLGDELLLFQQKYDSKANEKALWAQFFAEKNFAPRGVPVKVVGVGEKIARCRVLHRTEHAGPGRNMRTVLRQGQEGPRKHRDTLFRQITQRGA